MHVSILSTVNVYMQRVAGQNKWSLNYIGRINCTRKFLTFKRRASTNPGFSIAILSQLSMCLYRILSTLYAVFRLTICRCLCSDFWSSEQSMPQLISFLARFWTSGCYGSKIETYLHWNKHSQIVANCNNTTAIITLRLRNNLTSTLLEIPICVSTHPEELWA